MSTVHAWPIPTAYTPTRLTDGPVLYVGDAAAVVDPMTGEGIAQALETGMLAVDAIAAGGDSRRCRRALPRAPSTVPSGRDLRLAMRLQRILATPRGARGDDRALSTAPTGRAAASPAGCSRAIRARCCYTPDRWRRRRFTAPGAFWQTPAHG